MASKAALARKKNHNASEMLELQAQKFLEASFTMGTDTERGIITIVYKCSECGDIDTERLFADKPVPTALCCVKCRAGFHVPTEGWGVTDHPGMWPQAN